MRGRHLQVGNRCQRGASIKRGSKPVPLLRCADLVLGVPCHQKRAVVLCCMQLSPAIYSLQVLLATLGGSSQKFTLTNNATCQCSS